LRIKSKKIKLNPIRFIDKDQNKGLFFSTLKKRVDTYFKENAISKHDTPGMIVKTIILLSAYLLPFFYLLLAKPSFGLSLCLWLLMGFALAGIGMSVMHDANHGAYSPNSKVNKFLGHTLNVLGGSVVD
jgi:linoleoyl-CoA desaturase